MLGIAEERRVICPLYDRDALGGMDSVHLTLMTLAGAWHTGPVLAGSVVSCSPLLSGVKR